MQWLPPPPILVRTYAVYPPGFGKPLSYAASSSDGRLVHTHRVSWAVGARLPARPR